MTDINTAILATFTTFLKRDDAFTQEDAIIEAKFFESMINANNGVAKDVTYKQYFKFTRVGAHKRINRTARAQIMLTFGNAMNHATLAQAIATDTLETTPLQPMAGRF